MNFIVGVVSSLLQKYVGKALAFIYNFFKSRSEYKSIETNNKDLAKSVNETRKQIIDLIKSGQPVPKELEDKLIAETNKLVLDNSNGSGG